AVPVRRGQRGACRAVAEGTRARAGLPRGLLRVRHGVSPPVGVPARRSRSQPGYRRRAVGGSGDLDRVPRSRDRSVACAAPGGASAAYRRHDPDQHHDRAVRNGAMMTAPLRYPAFRFLAGGRLVTMLGNAVAPVALAFAVLDLTGSVRDLGLVV